MRRVTYLLDHRLVLVILAVQMADDVLDHHHCAVHHHAEIERAQREQVRWNVAQIKTYRSEEQRKRDRDRNDERAANIP